MGSFKSLKPLSVALYLLFGLNAAIGAIFVVASLLVVLAPDLEIDWIAGVRVNLGLAVVMLISTVETLTRFATIIVFLIWEYRAFANLHALGVDGVEFTPGMSLVWWIIPFACLLMPYKAISNLWDSSDPENVESFGSFVEGGATGLILGWWIAFLLRWIATWVSNGLVNQRGEIAPEFPYALGITGVFTVISAILALLIVRGIRGRQEALAANISMPAPPAPPVFEENGQ